jgi:hypothetical protein
MSDASLNGHAQAVEEMSRDELEAEVSELRGRVEDLEEAVEGLNQNTVPMTQLNLILDALLGGGVDDFTEPPATHRDAIEDFGRQLRDVKTRADRHAAVIDTLESGEAKGPDAAWKRVVDAANNLSDSTDHSLPNNRVALGREEIAQATGKTKRTAQDYIERFGENRRGADWRPYQPPSEQTGGEAKRKKLIVDLDVWGEDR